MTDSEAIGKAYQEKKSIDGELKTLRIKADRYAEIFGQLAQHLKTNPAGVVFDDQPSALGAMEIHYTTSGWDVNELKEMVATIRAKEARLRELTNLLA